MREYNFSGLFPPPRRGHSLRGEPHCMKNSTSIFGLIILVLSIVALLPATQEHAKTLIVVIAAAAIGLIIFGLNQKSDAAPVVDAPAEPAKPAPALLPPRADAEIIGMLSAFQAKGRLVDFLMDDITKYDDAQVGAASRVVHQGCRAVLDEHFKVTPQHDAEEGSSVTVPAGHAADEYRLTGNLSGEAPFTGTLVHKGWKTAVVKLPRLIEGADKDRLPAIALAEVEIK